ncbi:MAG: DNA-binding protein [Candidatus Marinimicrobia bacterium]|nr:DNA-binding protein [Candidatus Neomarinimicrobiota bacterium]OUW50198.1 MAG: hypothetical protein CBD50_03615 [bacterium TMED190]
MKTNRLGKGIGALIEDKLNDQSSENIIKNIMIVDIKMNPFQPRIEFDDNKINKLAASIKEKGLITPISVRYIKNSYQLVAGERRLRASKIAGLKEIPAYVLDIETDLEMMELALIENLQREDLDIFEEAQAYLMMIEKYKFSHDEIGKIVGKSRTNISNTLRLLKLPKEIMESLRKKEISAGHARALLGIKNPKKIKEVWQRILEREESVRSTEELISFLNKNENENKNSEIIRFNNHSSKVNNFKILEDELIEIMGTKVVISKKNKIGKVEISFFSVDDFNRLIEIFRKININ